MNSDGAKSKFLVSYAMRWIIALSSIYPFTSSMLCSIQYKSTQKLFLAANNPTPLPMVTPIESRVLTYQWHRGSFYNNLLPNQSSQLSGRLHMSPNQCQRQFEANRSRFASYNETLLSLMCLLLDSTYFFEQECSISCILEKNIKFNTALYQVFVSKHISTIRINSPSLCSAHIMWTNWGYKFDIYCFWFRINLYQVIFLANIC